MSQSHIILSDAAKLASETRTRTDINGANHTEHYERTSEAFIGVIPTPFGAYLENGASLDMAVDGSVTAQNFSLAPSSSEIYRVHGLSISMSLSAAPTMPAFGDLAELANGITLSVFGNVGTEECPTHSLLANLVGGQGLKSNNDLVSVGSVGIVELAGTYALQASIALGGPLRLDGGAGEYLKAVVSDDLSGLLRMRMFAVGQLESKLS